MLLERDDSLRALAERAARAARGNGGTVLLAGEAGIGKTTLLRAFAAQQVAPYRVFWGCCEPLSTARPLGPLQDMAALLDDELAALLDAGASPPRIFARVLDSLLHASPPSVLIFEDVHWADHATLDLIRYLGRRLPALPALLILSLRSDEVAPDHPLARLPGDLPTAALNRIELAPLSEAAVEQLARAAGREAHGVHALTAGNPFFINEILAEAGNAEDALPASVRDAVWARLARLDAQERWMLDLISVIPGAVEGALWTSLRTEDVAAAERCIARGILVRDAAGALAFRHELARQAVLAQLAPEEQRHLHAHVLALLERHAPMVHASLAQLAHHAAAAADAQRVLTLAPSAAAEAAALGAHRQAAQQLQTALRFVAQAPAALAAQLYQDWAYEAGLSVRIDAAVIAARHQAIVLWRGLNRGDKVAHNLCWLSRLHWYRGDGQQAEEYADAAVRELEALPTSAELAMAYSVRSQLHMLHDRFELAIEWGEHALALAEQVGDLETRVHALNNIGTAQLFGAGDATGRAKLEQSLQLALQHGFHEHAARVYTNLGEWAVVFRQFELAERMLGEGLAFGRSHDLDAWTSYLLGWQARLRMHQGRLREAEAIARSVVAMSDRSLVERLPALSALARIRVRTGDASAPGLLQQALAQASATQEVQHIAPVRLALVEAAWLCGDVTGMRTQLENICALSDASPDPWKCGEMLVWWQRAGLGKAPRLAACAPPPPWAAELAGDVVLSARLFEDRGSPIEAALALMQSRGKGAGEALVRAVRLLESTGAQALLRRASVLAHEQGVAVELPRLRRGHYGVARSHPLGLTARELQVLRLLAEGHGSTAISRHLSRSPRTIEHHIASVYAKLGLSNRIDLLLKLRDEPWLLQSEQAAGSFAPSRLRA